MSSKKCARCDKTVYPTEELKCLDKVWHKICFKCKVCGMSLNMRNYKGFNKEPYCDAHIPKAQATTMADTPEMRRIAENTKIQSIVKYHAEFEKNKGKFTQVADDPEIQRIKQNTQHISNVAYHGELLRKADMEKRRGINENGYKELPADVANANLAPSAMTSVTSSSQSHYQNSQSTHSTPSYHPQPQQPPQQSLHQHHQQQAPAQQQQQRTAQPQQHYNVQSTQQQHQQQQSSTNYNANKVPQQLFEDQSLSGGYTTTPTQRTGGGAGVGGGGGGGVGLGAGGGQTTLIYRSDQGAINAQPQRQIGSVHDMDPVNHNYGSLCRMYRAIYDYEAQDDDEVSFSYGDLIINVRSIDGGWMTGEVQRTGCVGMLPANYLEEFNL